MRIVLTALFAAFTHVAFSQSCSCLDDYHFIKDHVEKNHAGFNKKIISPDEPAYKAFIEKLETEIKQDQIGKYCIAHLKKYILYLQDHHSNIVGRSGTIKEDSVAAVEAFLKSPAYLSTEMISIDEKEIQLNVKESRPGIEGIYYTPDSTYVVALIKSKTPDRDYAGVVTYSKTKLWSNGQVKLELKIMNDSLIGVYTFLRNHALNYDEVPFSKGDLQLPGWLKAGNSTQKKLSTELISFQVLDSSTTLLSIRSFDASLYKKLDSAYRAVIPIIKNYPNLIIDVRNNGGGSDQSYAALMPLIYTDPFESDVVEIYNTPDNMKAYQDYDDKQRQSPTARQDVFKWHIEKMKTVAPYSFVPMGNNNPVRITYPKNKGNPVKIAVLYNRYCASSCESLLCEVMNSSKTIMVGENSGGYTGYGNVMTIATPCGNQLSWTTTAYRDRWKYEFVGIPPQFRVPGDETDWVEYTRRLLNQ